MSIFKDKIIQFLLWFFLPPFFLLLIILTRNFNFWPFLNSLVQLAAVCLEVLILFLILKKVFFLKKIMVALTSLIFLVINSYYIFDFFVFWQTGIRIDYQLLRFLLEFRSFLNSTDIFLLKIFLLSLSVLFILTIAFFLFVSKNSAQLQLRKKTVISFIFIFSLSVFLFVPFNSSRNYTFNNLILNDQVKFIKNKITTSYTWQDTKKIFCQNENFELVSDKNRLLKYTNGFSGDKQFSIDIEQDQRPHIIFLFLESFRAQDIGVLGGKYDITPNFDKLSKEGILFNNFYANGVQTSRAVVASLFGIMPHFSTWAAQTQSDDIHLRGLPEILKENGYNLSYIHNGSLQFEDKQGFFKAHQYDNVLGMNDISKTFAEAKQTGWGINDEYLMKYSADFLNNQDKDNISTFLTMFTVSHHHPWIKPDNFIAPIINTGSQEYSNFLQTMNYSDYCLGMFIDALKARGLYDKSIIFILADTSQPQGEHNNYMLVKNLYEENLKIPLLILAGDRIEKGLTIEDIGSQVDLLPTVMDILNIQGLNHSIGSSLMRKTKNKIIFFNNPFVYGYWGLKQGQNKYIYNTTTHEGFLYDLENDAYEDYNIASNNKEKDQSYKSLIFFVSNLFASLYRNDLFILN